MLSQGSHSWVVTQQGVRVVVLLSGSVENTTPARGAEQSRPWAEMGTHHPSTRGGQRWGSPTKVPGGPSVLRWGSTTQALGGPSGLRLR